MFASFCFSDETVRYAAILCLTKTHSRDEEPKNQWPFRKSLDFERLLLVQLPRCELDDLEEKKVVNLLSDEEPKNQGPFRKSLDFERLLLVQLPRCELYDYEEKKAVNLLSEQCHVKSWVYFYKSKMDKKFHSYPKRPVFKIQAVIRSYQYFNLK